jgi:hypothetical protein
MTVTIFSVSFMATQSIVIGLILVIAGAFWRPATASHGTPNEEKLQTGEEVLFAYDD